MAKKYLTWDIVHATRTWNSYPLGNVSYTLYISFPFWEHTPLSSILYFHCFLVQLTFQLRYPSREEQNRSLISFVYVATCSFLSLTFIHTKIESLFFFFFLDNLNFIHCFSKMYAGCYWFIWEWKWKIIIITKRKILKIYIKNARFDI